jgi:hypothetical protein
LPGARSVFPNKTETTVEKLPKPVNADRARFRPIIPRTVQFFVSRQRFGRVEVSPEDSHISLRIFAADEPAYVGKSAEQIRFGREQAMNVDRAGERLWRRLQRGIHFLPDLLVRPKLREAR